MDLHRHAGESKALVDGLRASGAAAVEALLEEDNGDSGDDSSGSEGDDEGPSAPLDGDDVGMEKIAAYHAALARLELVAAAGGHPQNSNWTQLLHQGVSYESLSNDRRVEFTTLRV